MVKTKKTTEYQWLSYVIPEGFEPSTYCLEGSCSIQLSYGTILALNKMAELIHDPVGLCSKLKLRFNLKTNLKL